jgi:hypothetical protein
MGWLTSACARIKRNGRKAGEDTFDRALSASSLAKKVDRCAVPANPPFGQKSICLHVLESVTSDVKRQSRILLPGLGIEIIDAELIRTLGLIDELRERELQ